MAAAAAPASAPVVAAATPSVRTREPMATPIVPTECPSCGRQLFASDNFCANCGHWSKGVVAIVGAARPSASPASTTRMPFRPVAVAITGVALVAFGVLIGVTVLAPDRPIAAASLPPKAVASASAEIHRVSVNVSVDETGGASVDPWADVAIGEPCPATEASLGDIGEGTSVIVKDQAGTLLARVPLPEGRKSGPGICTYRAKVPVPETAVYVFTVDDRPATVIAIADLSSAGWTMDLRYAVLP